jgi:peptide/nickel transport system substrate-binding protein
MRRRRVLGIVLAAGTILVSGCGYRGPISGAQLSTQSSKLTVAIGVDPDTLDPMRQTTTTVSDIVQMVTESLATVDQSGKVQPSLATGWQEAPDALSWVFTLRSDVTFTDGTPFDAAAVQANLQRIADPKSICPSCGALARSLKSVDVVDPQHVRLNLLMPLASDVVLGLLSTVTYDMLSPHDIKPGSPTYTQDESPVGTGPYILAGRVKGDHVTLRRNGSYWGARPAYAQQVFDVVPDAATREALVRSGQAQVILLPPASDLPSLYDDPTVRVLMAPGDRSVFFAIDTKDQVQPLLQNPQVRQALNFAINRDAIVKSTLFGAAEVATSTLAPSIFGYCQMPNQYQYNPDLARQMLQKANAGGLTISLVAPTGRYIQDFQAAQNVANDLRAVGVTVNGPRTMDWPSYVGTINVPQAKASVDVHMLGYAPGFLDASQAMTQFDPNLQPPKGLETSYYENAGVAGLLQKAVSEPDRNARAQEYCQAEQQVWNDAPWIFGWIQKFPIVYSAQVTGVSSVPNESFMTVYARPK